MAGPFRPPEPARQTGASSEKGGRRLSGRPCWNFAKGKCSYGDACAYLHDVATARGRDLSSDETETAKASICDDADDADDVTPQPTLLYFLHKSQQQLGADPARSLLARVLEQDGLFAQTRDVKSCRLFWGCASPTGPHLANLPHGAFVNHFPGTTAITHKHMLAERLRLHPEGDAIAPKTFILPAEDKQFAAYDAETHDASSADAAGARWIVKRAVGGEGRGTTVARDANEALEWTRTDAGGRERTWVAQKYVANPLAFETQSDSGERLKADLRAYVLLTRWNDDGTYTAYVYTDGLVRFAAKAWDPYDMDPRVHLTNNAAATDRTHEKAATPTGDSSTWDPDAHFKRNWSFKSLEAELEKTRGHGSYDSVWAGVRRAASVALSSLPKRERDLSSECPSSIGDSPRRHFELLGMDLLVDDALAVWLLEVNSGPSLGAGTKLGGRVSGTHHEVKGSLVADVFNLLGIGEDDPGADERDELRRASLTRFQPL